mmetsp:Transcript_22348/g.69819  ORF Transcript_22348/g.69819 Transcript_22348/m.69819 type:complete len:217 (+) Transcript_22348:4525-5175(+)
MKLHGLVVEIRGRRGELRLEQTQQLGCGAAVLLTRQLIEHRLQAARRRLGVVGREHGVVLVQDLRRVVGEIAEALVGVLVHVLEVVHVVHVRDGTHERQVGNKVGEGRCGDAHENGVVLEHVDEVVARLAALLALELLELSEVLERAVAVEEDSNGVAIEDAEPRAVDGGEPLEASLLFVVDVALGVHPVAEAHRLGPPLSRGWREKDAEAVDKVP